jgi:hypothetical protein
LPEAVLLATAGEALTGAAAELLGAAAELVVAGLAGAGAEPDADDDALTAGELGAAVELCFELEQPAKANAVTTTGSHTRRCIFTACSLTGSIENRGQRLRRHHVTVAGLLLPSGRQATLTSAIGGSRSYV